MGANKLLKLLDEFGELPREETAPSARNTQNSLHFPC
jgi:hypothetical protein